MMWKEFEELAGYEVSYKTYSEIIEPMYMAIPETMSKRDFINLLNKKALALPTAKELLREVKKEAAHLYEICGHYSDYESRERLERNARAYARRKWGENACIAFNSGYEYEEIQRGCTYPKELVIFYPGVYDRECETIKIA